MEGEIKNYYRYSLHRKRLAVLQVDPHQGSLSAMLWQLSLQSPALKMTAALDGLRLTDESSKDLFQEFKEAVKRNFEDMTIITNGHQLLVACSIDAEDQEKQPVKQVILVGVDLEFNSSLSVTKIEVKKLPSQFEVVHPHSLFKISLRSNVLACLVVDSLARRWQILALRKQRIERLATHRLPPGFPILKRLEDEEIHMPVFDQRSLQINFWNLEKKAEKVSVVANVFRLCL